MLHDILAGQQARSNTVVPGHWILDLPSYTPQIHIRRYRSLTPLSPSDKLDYILERVRFDPLEKAWRVVNGNEVGLVRGVAGVLEEGCAICVNTGTDESRERELWCFYVEKEGEIPAAHVEGLEGESST
jgi:hypothetical protein